MMKIFPNVALMVLPETFQFGFIRLDDPTVQAIVYNEDKINAVSLALVPEKLLSEDFEITVADAKEGDFIYFDPPYTVAHTNNGFVKYNAHIFSWADQER